LTLFVLASVTDLVDGYLARKWQQTSEFGAFLDPVADKLMVASALSLLVCNLPVWWFAIPVALVLCREISVSALREWMSSKGERDTVQVGNLGKWKTALQMISISLLLFSSNPTDAAAAAAASGNLDDVGLMQSMILSLGLLGFYISTALTMVSGYQYFKVAWPRLQPSASSSIEPSAVV
jgi:CDP-diacylglycerol---glycerol-3-phosphate 3-phosphatidyltransferase